MALPSSHIPLPQRLIRPLLDFEDDAAALQHFQAMPLAGGNVNAVLAFEGIEQKRFTDPAIAVVKKDPEPAPQQNVGFGRMSMPVHRQDGARLQGIEQALGFGVEAVVQVEVHAQAVAGLGLGGDGVEELGVDLKGLVHSVSKL